MGLTLTNTQIDNTYAGLLKSSDNAAIGATEKVIGDGLGNDSTLALGTASASFTGTLDLSGATVTGLPAGGLELGSGSATNEGAPKSMQSGSSVTTLTAQARGGGDIAIGDNAITAIGGTTFPNSSIAIGHNATVSNEKGFAMGRNATAGSVKSTSIGWFSTANGSAALAIGVDAKANGANSVALGTNSGYLGSTQSRFVSVGDFTGFGIGAQATAVGYYSTAKATSSVALGDNARVDSSAYTNAIAIGHDSSPLAVGNASIGNGVQGTWAEATSVNQLQLMNYANLNYADDTAASTGGVPLGGIYHTNGALKVRTV